MVCIILTAIKCCFRVTRVGTNATLISSQTLGIRHQRGLQSITALSVIGSAIPLFNTYYQQITHWAKKGFKCHTIDRQIIINIRFIRTKNLSFNSFYAFIQFCEKVLFFLINFCSQFCDFLFPTKKCFVLNIKRV